MIATQPAWRSRLGVGSSACRSFAAIGTLLVIVAALAGPLARSARAESVAARYQLGSSGDGTMFVLDVTSGRVWRYDRGEDAWFLYDLQALDQVPGHGAGARKRASSAPSEAPAGPGSVPPPDGAPPVHGGEQAP